MPKVIYTAAKGLVQHSGTGFEVSDAPIKQYQSHGVFLSNIDRLTTGTGSTGSHLNDDGSYFLFGDSTRKYVVWFKSSDASTPATQPALGAAYTYIEVTVTDAAAASAVAGLIKTAVEAVSSEVTVTVDSNGFDLEGNTPYAPVIALSVSSGLTSNTTVLNQIAGAGNSTFALNPWGHNHISQSIGTIDYNNASAVAYTLADGSYYGQEVSISFDLKASDSVTVNSGAFKGMKTADDVRGAALTLTATGAATKAAFIKLMWVPAISGDGWHGIDEVNVAIA